MSFSTAPPAPSFRKWALAPGHAPELWNLERPQAVCQVHASYLEAGAQVINANTFGANPLKEEELGVPRRDTG